MNAIQIRLHYAGPVLANLEISVNFNGHQTIINLEHPAVALLRLALNSPKSYLHDEQPVSEVNDEIKEENVNTKQVQPNVQRALEIIQGAFADEYPDFIEAIERGLTNYEPELCEEGVNGTYFLKDETGAIKGVFKPEDEEITSENNPKSAEDRDLKANSLRGILPGEAAKREVAAYLLDKDGFFGVPRTVLTRIQHPSFNSKDNRKVGSIQEFVENDGASWDVGPNIFPIKEVHKVGILDLYMLNLDRHGGNILIQEGQGKPVKLIPIDNGFSLPDSVAIPDLWFEWMNWSQSKKPFDAETLNFIEKLDVENDIKLLEQELAIRPACLRVMKISASLLKKGAAMGMTLNEIGSLLCPRSGKSALEEMVDAVLCKLNLESIGAISNEEQERDFFAILFSAMDQALAC